MSLAQVHPEILWQGFAPWLPAHATVSDQCSCPPRLCFSASSLKAGIRTIVIFHRFIMNLMIFY